MSPAKAKSGGAERHGTPRKANETPRKGKPHNAKPKDKSKRELAAALDEGRHGQSVGVGKRRHSGVGPEEALQGRLGLPPGVEPFFC